MIDLPRIERTEQLPSIASRRSGRRQGLFSTVRFLIVCLAIFLAARTVVPTVAIEGESMSPTLHTGGRIVLNGVYRFGSPHRGDIIVFDPPVASDTPYIKRVVGLPGETVEIHDGAVYIDGEPLAEPYLDGVATRCATYCALTVPPDTVFVMGDNRPSSSDSRDFGPVAIDAIVGEALFSLWPVGTVE